MPSTTTRLDPDDLYGWSQIDTTFDDDGLLFSQSITYDTGMTLLNSYFPDGYISPVGSGIAPAGKVSMRVDSPVNLSVWDSIEQYFSLTAPTTVIYEKMVFDDGLEKRKFYDDAGDLKGLNQYDFGDAKGWQSIEQTFGETARDMLKSTVYDNGDILTVVETQYEYNPDSIFYRQETTRQDVSDTKDYVYKTEHKVVVAVSELDPTQKDIVELTSSITLYDNGILVDETTAYEAGRGLITKTDQNNVVDWATISEELANDGSKIIRTTFDDGGKSADFLDPNGNRILFFADDPNGEYIRNEDYFYDNVGQITQSTISINGDMVYRRYYEDGKLVRYSEDDFYYDVRPFVQRTTKYDATCDVIERFTTSDDGHVNRIETFVDGNRTEILMDDHKDSRSWTSIKTTYDDTGKIAERLRVDDDGVERLESFLDGVRSQTVTTDVLDANVNETDIWAYDLAGVVTSRVLTKDDGVVRTETFTDGVRTRIFQEDTLDTQRYTTSTTEISPETGTQTRVIAYDNFFSLLMETLEGVLRQKVEIDNSADGSLRNFTAKISSYDADGKLTSQRTEYDDRDEIILRYAGDALAQKIAYDGDNSESWLIQVTDYVPDSPPVVTTYDAIGDVPAEIAEEFFLMSGG